MLRITVVELALLAVMWAVFAVQHVRTRGWWRLPDGRPNIAGRQLAAMAVVGLVETVSLVAAGSGHAPPLGTYAVVFGAANIVMARWLWLQWRARRERQEHVD